MPYLNSEIKQEEMKVGYITYRMDDSEIYDENLQINTTDYMKIGFLDSNGTLRYYLIREPTLERNKNGKDQYTKDVIEYREDMQSILTQKLNRTSYPFVNNFIKK